MSANHINDVFIKLPDYNTTNLSVHHGTYSVQAENCTGTSNFTDYVFQRESDWWCECPQFDPCTCPPVFNPPSHDPCGGHPQKLEVEDFKNLNLYPNPTTGNFKVELPDNQKQITITDVTGRVIYQKTTIDSEINIELNNQSSGIYFLTVKTDIQVYKNKLSIQK